MKTISFFCLCLAMILPAHLRSQIRLDTAMALPTLVGEHLAGKRIKLRNIRYNGAQVARSYFRDEAEAPLIGDGILLSTGSVFNALGPNRLSKMSSDLNRKGDRALQYIGKGPTFDAAMLEFDFMPQLDFVSFNFIFASEEYTEYVGSQFNDVFAFYITGPGLAGTRNLAVIPGSGTPITVNSVNHIFNKQNYIDNDQFGKRGQVLAGKASELDQYLYQTFEFDGMTTLLRAETPVIPGEVYHIRICIADVGDHIYDSAVFLEGNSFSSYPKDPEKRALLMAEETSLFRRREQPTDVGEKPVVVAKKDSLSPTPALPVADPTTSIWTSADLAMVKGNPWHFEFGFDVFQLADAHEATLDTILAFLKQNPNAKLRIEGHTDNVGGAAYNQKLSRKRAESVQKYLLAHGIPANRTETAFFGFDRPLNSNAAESGRARNRRVEIILLK